jgi:DNA-directed RNA polymerase specialized sigma24 family protein
MDAVHDGSMNEPVSQPAAVWAAIEALAPDERQALVLVCVLGLSYADAAVAAGVGIEDLRHALVRARAALASESIMI